MDRLYQEMEDYYSTGTNDDNDAADHRDETASTSSIHEPDFDHELPTKDDHGNADPDGGGDNRLHEPGDTV